MGAKKDRDLKVLDHRAKKFKQKVAEMKNVAFHRRKLIKWKKSKQDMNCGSKK